MGGDELRRVRITGVAARRLEWAVGRDISLPASVLDSLAVPPQASELDLRRIDAPRLNGLASDLRVRAAFTDRFPHSARLPFSYQYVPPAVRSYLGRQIGRRLRSREREWARFPGWPLDLSADFVADWMSAGDPAPGKTPVLLTHDIDSAEGLRKLVELFLPLEEAAGARSGSYVVPCAWRLDHGLLREVVARGHEIGVHGYDHSNRTPFLERGERRRRLSGGRAALDAYEPWGYRAPSLVRTAGLLEDVADYFEYDSSIPTSGGPFPTANNGCATARPFRIGRLLEIPISLRRDGMAQFLGYSPAEIGRMWQEDARDVAAARGVVVLLTHCEARFSANPPMLAAYREFLEFISGSAQFECRLAGRLARTPST
jgi:peptidoglycan/xylan/chitin deacetylase (PgdA/CDA1 family)